MAEPPLSSKLPIAYVTIRVFSHATEDPQKVQTAIRNILPEALQVELVSSQISLTGHHGNPIVIHEAKLTDRQALPQLLDKLGATLSSLDKEQLNEELRLHLEKSNLYLRLDKQSAFLGALKLGTEDSIHLKIHFKNKKPQEIVDLCRKAGLLP
jgi:RNA-binding protein